MKTIKALKETAFFKAAVVDISTGKMTKEGLGKTIDKICDCNPQFEDAFLDDCHKAGLELVWAELNKYAEKLIERTAKK